VDASNSDILAAAAAAAAADCSSYRPQAAGADS